VNSILSLAKEIEAESGGRSPEAIETIDDVGTATLDAVCERVKAAVTADGDEVVFHLKAPFAPFVHVLAGYWASILDMEWVAAEVSDDAGAVIKPAGWDGSCANWRQFYNQEKEASELFAIANGTGPYLLERWRREEEIVLTRNDSYWRDRPAHLKQVVMKFVPEWSTRLLMLEAGDADVVTVPATNRDQVRPLVEQGTLREIANLPSATMSFFNMNQLVAAENNAYIGSGRLDGNGVPPDFFSDPDIRKAFAHAFDWQVYIRDGLDGDGIQARGPIPSDVQGFNPEQPVYSFDLAVAADHLGKAFDGEVAQSGFTLVVPITPGSAARQVAWQLYETAFAQIDPKYRIVIQEFQSAQINDDIRADRIPFNVSVWHEDYHDAHNWAFPILGSEGYYGRLMDVSDETRTRIDQLIAEGRVEQDAASRALLYTEIQQLNYDEALTVPLVESVGRAFQPSSVSGIVRNPAYPGTYYWDVSKGNP
jgi:peptide/nickel transport system substrate-binding protein